MFENKKVKTLGFFTYRRRFFLTYPLGGQLLPPEWRTASLSGSRYVHETGQSRIPSKCSADHTKKPNKLKAYG